MRTLASLLAVAAIAAFGFTGAAMAADQTIVDGDAESGLTNWNTSDGEVATVARSSTNLIPPAANHSSLFFSLGEADIADGGTAFLDQDVSATNPLAGVWGCGVEGLQGSYTVNGLGASADSDTGLVTASFFNPLDIFIASASVAAGDDSGDFSAFGIGTNDVPENSATMNVALTGTEAGSDLKVDVGYDDVSVTLTGCLDSFAKISGKVMGTGGQRGQFSLVGTVGIDHADGTTVVFTNPFNITYKTLKVSCNITPTALTFDSGTAVVTADYTCVDKDGAPDVSGTDMTIRLTAGTGGSNAGGSGRNRGSVCVHAPDDTQLNIGTSPCDDNTHVVALKNGNVNTDDDTSNGPLI